MNSIEPNGKQISKLLRLLPAIAIVVFGGSFLFFVTDRQSVTGRPSVDMLLAMAIINLGFYIAIRVLSKLTFKSQLLILIPFIAVQIAAFACLKFDGLYGDGRPILAFRFSNNPAIDSVSGLKKTGDDSSNQPSPPDAPSTPLVDLPKTGPHDWTTFRGTKQNGIVDRKFVSWTSKPPREIWRIPIGEGWSAFVGRGPYCFTQEQRGENEAVVCREISTGSEIWVHLDPASFVEPSGGNGPRATPTLTDDDLLYSLGATGILNCLNASTGEAVWSVNILQDNDADNLLFGMGASPTIYEDLVIVCPGGKTGAFAAYDRKSGEKVWTGGTKRASYCSPKLVEFHSETQVLNFNGDGVDSHDLSTGNILWHIPFANQSPDGTSVCQPIVLDGNRIFISSGYEGGCTVFQISKNDDRYQATEVWANKNLKSKFADAIKQGKFIYGLDNGILVCIDSVNGDRKWRRGRFGHGQLLLVGSQLLIQAEKGHLVLVNADPEKFVEVGTQKALDRRTWTHPVITGKYLLIRNDREAICFEVELE